MSIKTLFIIIVAIVIESLGRNESISMTVIMQIFNKEVIITHKKTEPN